MIVAFVFRVAGFIADLFLIKQSVVENQDKPFDIENEVWSQCPCHTEYTDLCLHKSDGDCELCTYQRMTLLENGQSVRLPTRVKGVGNKTPDV